MKKLPVSRIGELLKAMAETRKVYLPVEKQGMVNYGLWNETSAVRLDALNTAQSAKELFFPQCENMIDFQMEGKSITIRERELMDEPFVVMGVRACDLKGIEILDSVFLADPIDPFYQARRAHGVILTMACANPEKSCFCSTFGIDAANPAGDVAMWTIGDTLYWNAQSEKGEALTSALNLLEDADDAAVTQEKQRIGEAIENLPYAHLDLSAFTGERMTELFKSPKWQTLSEACLGCGGCTFACPTCQCYDVRDFDTGHGVERYRCWDSCMYNDFTMMAHGTPRPTQVERFRQRFMHKLVYYPMNNEGVFGCVGCGRCVRKCPSSINIIKVIQTLGREKDHV